MGSHREFLLRLTLDPALIDALEPDYTTAPIPRQERVRLGYVVKLTQDATQVSRNDHDELRAVGRQSDLADYAHCFLVQLTSTAQPMPSEWDENESVRYEFDFAALTVP